MIIIDVKKNKIEEKSNNVNKIQKIIYSGNKELIDLLI